MCNMYEKIKSVRGNDISLCDVRGKAIRRGLVCALALVFAVGAALPVPAFALGTGAGADVLIEDTETPLADAASAPGTQADAAATTDADSVVAATTDAGSVVTPTPTPAAASAAGTGADAAGQELSARYADLTQAEKAEILSRLGVLKGDPDLGLMLDIKVRRSDAAVFFTRLLGQEQYVTDRAATDFATSRFPDAPQGMWYTPYISYCTSIGIVAGRTDGKFYPDDNISEKEFANVLLKILGYVYETDYNWDNLYEFAYDIGLFDDPAYAARTEDNREYFRRDVCDQVFAVLGLEKKDSPKLLIEELVETGAVSKETALGLGFDLSALSDTPVRPGGASAGGGEDLAEEADIYAVYHLERDLLWVVFTKAVTFGDDAVEVCQTYDYSKILSVQIEEKTARDLLLRTGNQEPNMDYTIDISNVLEADGTNAGMLSFDFVGFDPRAAKDSAAGLTSIARGTIAPGGLETPSGDGTGTPASGTDTGTGAGVPSAGNTPTPPSGATGTAADGSAGAYQGQGTGVANAGNADPSAEYFRVINAYTTASDELMLYFSHPVSEAALNASLYNISQDSALLSSGASGQITAAPVENTVNAVRLTASGLKFAKGAQYRVTVSGRLTSVYTARLNEGGEDAYTFVADNVAERGNGFTLKSIVTNSQYALELEFSQPVNTGIAAQTYNYQVLDSANRPLAITAVSVVPGSAAPSTGLSAPSAGSGSTVVRLSLSQPFTGQQDYNLIVIYAQDAAQSATIANQTYPFQYGGQGGQTQRSELALTGAIANDPSTAEVYFNMKLDAASATVASHYAVSGAFESGSYTVTPSKVSYDPVLTPYMVRLYFPADRRFRKDTPYSLRVYNTLRDEKKLSSDRTLEMQFFANNLDTSAPALKDAVIVGEDIVRLDFTKEIQYDPTKITEGNFALVDSALSGQSALLTPILIKYINATTVILIFDDIDMTRTYSARVGSITDYSGAYTARYPNDPGTTVSLRNGKR